MYSIKESAERLVTAAGELAETRLKIARLKVAGKMSESLSGILCIIMLVVFGGGVITILSFGLAYLIGERLNNMSYGFFIVGVMYVLAGLLVFYKRKQWIQEPLRDMFIDKFTDDEN